MRWPSPTPLLAAPLLLLSAGLTACGPGSPQAFTTDSGVQVEILSRGRGEPPPEDRYLAIHYEATLADGTVFDSSRRREEPLCLARTDEFLLPGLAEGLAGIRSGERRHILVPAGVAYGASGKHARIPAQADLHYEVEVVEVFESTESGLQYRAMERTGAALPGPGQTCVVEYASRLRQGGREFDSSQQRGRPLEFRLGEGLVLPGLEECVARMPAGSRFQAILPPDLAYGDRGLLGAVPPDTPVFLELHLKGIRRQ